MEVLEYEERQFRYKLMNVFFQYIKTALQISVFGYNALQLMLNYENDACSDSQRQFINIVILILDVKIFNGALSLLVFNVIAAIYILCQKHFVRIEFFITYALNLIWFVVQLLYALREILLETAQCVSQDLIIKTVIFMTIVNQLDIILIMVLKHETSNRQVNICSNSIAIFLVFTCQIPVGCAYNTQSMEFMLVAANVLPLVLFTSLNFSLVVFSKMKEQLYNTFRFGLVLVLSFMIINYLLVVYDLSYGDIQTDSSCIQLIYIAESYKWIVPITLSGLVPIIYSINLSKILLEQDDDDEIQPQDVQVHQVEQPVNVSYMQNVSVNQQQYQPPSRFYGFKSNFPNDQSGILPPPLQQS